MSRAYEFGIKLAAADRGIEMTDEQVAEFAKAASTVVADDAQVEEVGATALDRLRARKG